MIRFWLVSYSWSSSWTSGFGSMTFKTTDKDLNLKLCKLEIAKRNGFSDSNVAILQFQAITEEQFHWGI